MYKPFKINWVIKISPLMLVNSLQSQIEGLECQDLILLGPRAISRASGYKISALGKSFGHRGMYFPFPNISLLSDTFLLLAYIGSIHEVGLYK